MRFTIKIKNNPYTITLYEIFGTFAFICMLIVASPYLGAQFKNLQKSGDILWNLCLDGLIIVTVLTILIVIVTLLNRFDDWSERNKNRC